MTSILVWLTDRVIDIYKTLDTFKFDFFGNEISMLGFLMTCFAMTLFINIFRALLGMLEIDNPLASSSFFMVDSKRTIAPFMYKHNLWDMKQTHKFGYDPTYINKKEEKRIYKERFKTNQASLIRLSADVDSGFIDDRQDIYDDVKRRRKNEKI